MNRLRAKELSLREGVDAVFWKTDGVLLGSAGTALTGYDDVVPVELQKRAQIISKMLPHLPQPEAIVVVGKHNVRVLGHRDECLIVFLRSAHPVTKSIKRTMRRVLGLPRSW